jgi:hypothetical protein
MPITAEDSPSGLQKLGSLTDIFAKLCAGAAAIFAGIYLTWWKNDFDVNAKCLELIGGVASEYRGKFVRADEIDSRSGMLERICKMPKQQLLDIFRSVIKVQENEPATPQGPTSVLENAGSPVSEANKILLSGWVAVGFIGSTVFSEINFDKADGATLTATPGKDALLRARWQVNVRPGPADWSKTEGVLGTGQCFQVMETRVLPAAGRNQTWAMGHAEQCPPRTGGGGGG